LGLGDVDVEPARLDESASGPGMDMALESKASAGSVRTALRVHIHQRTRHLPLVSAVESSPSAPSDTVGASPPLAPTCPWRLLPPRRPPLPRWTISRTSASSSPPALLPVPVPVPVSVPLPLPLTVPFPLIVPVSAVVTVSPVSEPEAVASSCFPINHTPSPPFRRNRAWFSSCPPFLRRFFG
jgi:hypothetical protein